MAGNIPRDMMKVSAISGSWYTTPSSQYKVLSVMWKGSTGRKQTLLVEGRKEPAQGTLVP